MCCHTWNPVKTLTYLCTLCLRITEIKITEIQLFYLSTPRVKWQYSRKVTQDGHPTMTLQKVNPPPHDGLVFPSPVRGIKWQWQKKVSALYSGGDCGDVPHKWLPGGWLYVATQTRPVLCIFLMLQQTFYTCVSGICCLVFA